MNDEAAFLTAIAATPDDNTVRLVYADWLDEQNRPEAGFIRTECELASAPFGNALWHDIFAKYQKQARDLPASWRNAVCRSAMNYWLKTATRSAWQRIENWCKEFHPALLEVLSSGATADQIEAVERAVGQPLPADARESLTIHNGSTESFIFSDELYSTERIIPDLNMWGGLTDMNEDFRETMSSFPKSAIALDYANPGWIPMTRAGGSDYLGVDLAPGPKGTIGQVINFGRDEHHKAVLASGWATFLADYATFLESGAIKVIHSEPDLWGDCCAPVLGGHTHDVLVKWRRERRWPSRKKA